jgi:hypothetical protein
LLHLKIPGKQVGTKMRKPFFSTFYVKLGLNPAFDGL